jgi:hypothetical protein
MCGDPPAIPKTASVGPCTDAVFLLWLAPFKRESRQRDGAEMCLFSTMDICDTDATRESGENLPAMSLFQQVESLCDAFAGG